MTLEEIRNEVASPSNGGIKMTYWINDKLGVISLFESMTEEGTIIVDVRDLSDVEKSIEKVMNKINVISSLLCMGEKVAIRCIAGMNRSCAIALGVMCYMGAKGTSVDETWEHHLKVLEHQVKRCQITPQLERTVKSALHKLDGRYKQ